MVVLMGGEVSFSFFVLGGSWLDVFRAKKLSERRKKCCESVTRRILELIGTF